MNLVAHRNCKSLIMLNCWPNADIVDLLHFLIRVLIDTVGITHAARQPFKYINNIQFNICYIVSKNVYKKSRIKKFRIKNQHKKGPYM